MRPENKKTFTVLGILALVGIYFLSKREYPNLDKFDLRDELTKSDTATTHNITEQFSPPSIILDNADYLAKNVINPILEKFGRNDVKFISWYRHQLVNSHEDVGGAANSFHLGAYAVDLRLIIDGEIRNDLLLEFIATTGMKFTEMALEYGERYNPRTVHIALVPKREMEHEVLSIKSPDTKVLTYNWFLSHFAA